MPVVADGGREDGREDGSAEGSDAKAVAARLRMAVKLAGGNQKVLERVKALGGEIPVRSLGHYLSGVEMKTRPLVLLARACNVSLDWLASGQPPMHTLERLAEFEADTGGSSAESSRIVSAVPGAGFTMVPRYDLEAPASIGGALSTAEEIVDHLAFKTSWLRDTLHVALDKLALLTAIGDSMEPTIFSGDLLLLELKPEHLIEGAIYVLMLDGLRKVKRIQRLTDGTYLIRSDNPKYEPDRIPPEKAEHHLQIIGRVRWSGRVL